MKLLVVDDTRVKEVISKMHFQLDYECTVANSGEEVLNVLRDVIFP